jgi:hypothetical protein
MPSRPGSWSARNSWDGIVGLFAARLGTRLARGTRAATKLNVVAGLTFGLLALALLADVLFAD